MAKQVVFFLIVLSVGLVLGMFVLGPSFRADNDPKPGTSDLSSRDGMGKDLDDLVQSLQKRQSMEARKRYKLQERMVELEHQFIQLQLNVESMRDEGDPEIHEDTESLEVQKDAEESEEKELDREEQLVAAGLDPEQAKLLMRFLGGIEMDRLYLQDQATREGWMGSTRYRQEFLALREREKNIRQELGESDYDKYLFGSGKRNRVVIQSIIEGSPAQDIGIQIGDIVYSYAGKRLFAVNDLKTATTEGTGGEMVSVEIIRGGDKLDFYLPRGPLGVRLKNESIRP